MEVKELLWIVMVQKNIANSPLSKSRWVKLGQKSKIVKEKGLFLLIVHMHAEGFGFNSCYLLTGLGKTSLNSMRVTIYWCRKTHCLTQYNVRSCFGLIRFLLPVYLTSEDKGTVSAYCQGNPPYLVRLAFYV